MDLSAPIRGGRQSVSDRLVEGLDQSGEDAGVQVHPPQAASVQDGDDARDEHAGIADQPATRLGHSGGSVCSEVTRQRRVDVLAVGG